MKKSLTAVLAAILACLTLYAQAVPAAIETEYAGETGESVVYESETAAELSGEYPNLIDLTKITNSWNAKVTVGDDGVITVVPNIQSTYTTFKYPMTFKAGTRYELSYEIAWIGVSDSTAYVEPHLTYVNPGETELKDNRICANQTDKTCPDINGDWLKVSVTADVPVDYTASENDAFKFIAYQAKSYSFKIKNLTLREADNGSNVNDWYSYTKLAVVDDELNPGNKCIGFAANAGDYPVMRYKINFEPGATYKYSFKFAFTTVGATDTPVPDQSNFTMYAYYAYYDSAEAKNKSFSDVITGSGKLSMGENGWDWQEFSGTFVFAPKSGYDYVQNIDWMPWGFQITTANSAHFKIDDFVIERVSAPETLTDAAGAFDAISYRDTTKDAGVRFLAAADNSKHRADDVEEYGWIVARKTDLDALGVSAYGLTFNIDPNKYATGVSYNKATGEDKHLSIDFEDNTTLFTGVVTGIPSKYNDDVVVARTYIRYSDGTISYGTPVAASVKSAKEKKFETL